MFVDDSDSDSSLKSVNVNCLLNLLAIRLLVMISTESEQNKIEFLFHGD